MNKKYLTFGIVGLFAMAMITAGVVSYISNTSTIEMSVENPVQTWINGDEAQISLDLGTVLGGETINFIVNERNNANTNIDRYNLLLVVTSDNTFDGSEIVSVSNNGVPVPISALKYIRANGNYIDFTNIAGENTNVATIMMATDGINLAQFTQSSGSEKANDIAIELNAGLIPGNYVIDACVVYDLVGATCN